MVGYRTSAKRVESLTKPHYHMSNIRHELDMLQEWWKLLSYQSDVQTELVPNVDNFCLFSIVRHG